jgi:hypothetical protein
MVMASLENALRNDQMQAYFSQGMIQKAIQPLLSLETFTAGPASSSTSLSMPVTKPQDVPAP